MQHGEAPAEEEGRAAAAESAAEGLTDDMEAPTPGNHEFWSQQARSVLYEGGAEGASNEGESEATLEERFMSVSLAFRAAESPIVTQEEQLKLYALYKQARLGECDMEAPSRMDMVSSAKHGAWKAL